MAVKSFVDNPFPFTLSTLLEFNVDIETSLFVTLSSKSSYDLLIGCNKFVIVNFKPS